MGKPVNTQPAGYTQGEVKALIAPILGISAEDIDGFIIITRGKCEHCDDRDGYTTLDNIRIIGAYAEILNQAMDIRIAKDMRNRP